MKQKYLSILWILGFFLMSSACETQGGKKDGSTSSGDTGNSTPVDTRPIPTIGLVFPRTGSADGGTDLVIAGTLFEAQATVKIGELFCNNVVVVSDMEIHCSTGGHDVGMVNVSVSNPGGRTGTAQNAFTYIPLAYRFAEGGRVTVDFLERQDTAQAMKVLNDGKTLVAGTSVDSQGNGNIKLIRLQTNGTMDLNFSNTAAGIMTDDLGMNETVRAMAVQSDGKILIAGRMDSIPAGGNYKSFIVRYLADGSARDASFGTDGVIYSELSYWIMGMAIDEVNNRLVVLGNTGSTGFHFKRYVLASGAKDLSFNGTGENALSFNGSYTMGNALILDSSGDILAGGMIHTATQYEFLLAKVRGDNGVLDVSFGNQGLVQTAIGTLQDQVFALAIQSGKIIAAGSSQDCRNSYCYSSKYVLTRYTASGALDDSFGNHGIVLGIWNEEFPDFDTAYAIGIDPFNQDILMGGQTTSYMGFVKFQPNGELDTAFGVSGKMKLDFGFSSMANFGSFNNHLAALDYNPSSNLWMVVGSATYMSTKDDFAIAAIER